jgi:hypothetical protein
VIRSSRRAAIQTIAYPFHYQFILNPVQSAAAILPTGPGSFGGRRLKKN